MATELTPRDLLEAAAGGDVGEVMKLLDASSNGQSELIENLKGLNIRDSSGQTALHLSVEQNDIVAMQTLVGAGADINLQNKMFYTPLQLAVIEDRPSCVDELIKLGADIKCVDTYKRNALILAAEYGKENCLKVLLKSGADIQFVDGEGKNALMRAACYGQDNCLKLLIKAGVDLNLQVKNDGLDNLGPTGLMLAAESRKVNCVELLLEAGADVNVKTSDGETALHFTCKTTKTLTPTPREHVSNNESEACDCIRTLIGFGSDVMATDSKGQTALMYAARNNNEVHLLSILVDAGAVVDQQDSSGMTALAHAVSTGSPECVRWLVDHGASVNNRCDHSGKTVLHYLMYDSNNRTHYRAKTCLEILLSKHPDVNATDKDGKTPLMYVAQKSEWDTGTMAMLLQHGAEINLVDNQGQTALIYALKLASSMSEHPLSYTYRIRFLLNKGAKFSVGQIASGRLSKLALLNSDLDMSKLQVGSAVDLRAPWKEFDRVYVNRRVLQFLIINGVMPSQPRLPYKHKRRGELTNTSILKRAEKTSNPGVVKYLIATCYVLADDFKLPINRSLRHQFVLSVMNDVCSQPWPLVKLCFIAVSTAFGGSPGRQERVKNSQLPVKIQNMLLFQEPSSRLCVHQWDEIPLTFSPEEYEKLPRSHPLLYHWPVGRALVPCDCGECDGTMYRYEINEQKQEENDNDVNVVVNDAATADDDDEVDDDGDNDEDDDGVDQCFPNFFELPPS